MKINYSFLLLIVFSLYIGYFDRLLIFLVAFVIHEIGHLFFILILNVKINSFELSMFGGNLKIQNIENISKYKKFFIYVGGILFNFVFFILFKSTFFGKVNLILLIFNMFPIVSLDGFNIFKLFVNKTIMNNINVTTLCILLMIGLYFNSLGILIIVLLLIFKNIEYFKNKDNIYLLQVVRNMV